MNVIDNEVIVACDVDDTLVMWSNQYTQPHEGAMAFNDPYDKTVVYLKPHKRHIALLKKYKGRGFRIKVWSAGGAQWAASVVRTLGLEDIVDDVETKPAKYIDDLQANEVLGVRIYLKDEEE